MTLNGILNHKTKSVLLAAALLGATGLLSRFLGFGRNALLAYFYGAGDVLDAYFLAFRLPDFVFNLLFFGAFSAGFVPVFIKLKNENNESAWELVSDILNITLVIFIIFGVVFFIIAPWVLELIAPGFDSDKMKLAVTLSRIMFLQPIFLGVSMIFSGILQSNHRFLSYSLAPIFYNIGIILGILFFAPKLGPSGLAWGVVLGALLHMLVQYPAAKASGFSYKPTLSLNGNSLKRIFRIIVPRSASLILNQLGLVAMAGLASFLGSGRVAIFNFANDLNSLILGVVAVPLGVAVFPIFSKEISRGRMKEFGEMVIRTLRQLLFLMVPATTLFFILRAQIVRLTLGYGKFDWVDTVLTIQTLGLFLIGLVFQGVLAVIMRAFFALEDAKTTFWVSVIGILVGLASAFVLSPKMDVPALALGMSIIALFNTLVLLFILSSRVGSIKISELAGPLGTFIFGSIIAALGTYGALHFLDRFLNTHKVLHLIIQSGLAGLFGVALYILISIIFNNKEAKDLLCKCGFSKFSSLPDTLDGEITRS